MSSKKNDDLIYKALADSRRREILDILKNDPMKTGDICSKFRTLDRCTVMQHLGVLEKAGLVVTRKEGRFKWNYLNAVPIREIYARWINRYATPSVEVLSKLKNTLDKAVK